MCLVSEWRVIAVCSLKIIYTHGNSEESLCISIIEFRALIL